MSSFNGQQLTYAQTGCYDVDVEYACIVRQPGHRVPPTPHPSNFSELERVSVTSLAALPKPTPVFDFGVQSLDYFPGHKCLKNGFWTVASLCPFVVSLGTEFGSIFPGCRHVMLFREYNDVLIHIYQEHLARVEKEYFCILCNRQYTLKQDARRHAITATHGAIYACDLCPFKTERKDSLDAHKRLH